MTAKLENLAEQIERLPISERAFLAERLIASLDQSDVEQTWIKEAKRRDDEIRSGKVKPIPSEEVYAEIDRLLER